MVTSLVRLWRRWKLDLYPSRTFRGLEDCGKWFEERALLCADMKSKFPVRYFLQETLPGEVSYWWSKLRNVTYWIRTHTYNRYHVLNLKDPRNGYRWGWHDRDGLMLIACFKLLSGFVEKEMSQNCYYSEATEHCPEWDRRAEQAEILALYKWWNEDRPKKMMDPNYVWNHVDDEEDQAMLKRLIEIREALWS
jgi:hypothetical protein